jgi:hypothetical protein
MQKQTLGHYSWAPSFWSTCTTVPAQTSEKNPLEPLAFFVEGNLLGNIGIQSLDHFYFENWRKFECKRVKSNCLCKPELPRTMSPHDATSARRTRPARTRRGAGVTAGPRPAAPPLCARACDACVEA